MEGRQTLSYYKITIELNVRDYCLGFVGNRPGEAHIFQFQCRARYLVFHLPQRTPIFNLELHDHSNGITCFAMIAKSRTQIMSENMRKNIPFLKPTIHCFMTGSYMLGIVAHWHVYMIRHPTISSVCLYPFPIK
jgi:hypothetical protein